VRRENRVTDLEHHVQALRDFIRARKKGADIGVRFAVEMVRRTSAIPKCFWRRWRSPAKVEFQASMMPRLIPIATACVRPLAASLDRMLLM
jgi:hypothetical protein